MTDETVYRVLSIRDPLGDAEEELEQISMTLDLEGIPHTIIADEADPGAVDRYRVDIVVLDYGGISAMGAYETALFNIRYVVNWAEDHPSTALLIWTFFTAQIVAESIYEKEISEAFDNTPANVFNVGGHRSENTVMWDLIRAMIGAG